MEKIKPHKIIREYVYPVRLSKREFQIIFKKAKTSHVSMADIIRYECIYRNEK